MTKQQILEIYKASLRALELEALGIHRTFNQETEDWIVRDELSRKIIALEIEIREEENAA